MQMHIDAIVELAECGSVVSEFAFTPCNGERFAHLKDPQIAYQQLIGHLGKPQVFVQRLAEWRKKAPPAHLQAVEQADSQRKILPYAALLSVAPKNQLLADEDWGIVLSSPLLSMFENDQHFKLIALEFQSTLRLDGTFNATRYERIPSADPKLRAVPLDATSVIYVVPALFPVAQRSIRQQLNMSMTQGTKISAQFILGADQPDNLLVLPQPSPDAWSAFTPADHRRPPDGQTPPYWHIEIAEYEV